MTQLVHGGDIYTPQARLHIPILDFSANINPLGMPEGARKAIEEAVFHCEAYPDPLCRELTKAIAQAEQVSPNWVLCGNGAADLIFRLVYACQPKKAMILAPTFVEYHQALTAAGCQVEVFSLMAEEEFQLNESILEALDDSFDLLFLCNPNNPTGQPVERELMERILDRCHSLNILLAADECFNDFLSEPQRYSIKSSLGTYPNLFVLKAFTKIYAMAGVRLGYALCSDPQLLDRLICAGQPWSVSSLAQAAGVAALKDEDYLEQTTRLIASERKFLIGQLSTLGLTVIGSKANYIFFQTQGVSDLKERLMPRGILIRSCGNYPGLDPTYYRIAVKSRRDNEALLRQLAEILKGEIHS